MSQLVEQAFNLLYPERSYPYTASLLKYSRAFKGYNANVKYTKTTITFKLGYDWKEVSDDIKIGLLQSLFLKIFKDKKESTYIDIYNNFLRNIHLAIPKNKSDPELEASFIRVNEKYFNGMMDKPNLVWGEKSVRKVGCYEYTTDTIVMSSHLKGELMLLDYVMYHELLHKKIKFYNKGNRSFHHTTQFKQMESEFEDKEAEKKLKNFLRKKRFFKWF